MDTSIISGCDASVIISTTMAADLKEKIDLYLQNKSSFYQFLLRKDYFMPSYKCEAVNVPFMNSVFVGTCFMPKQKDVHPASIATPPSVEKTKSALIAVLEAKEERSHSYLAGVIRRKEFNRSWMLSVLRTLNPEHTFFTEGYQYVRPRKHKEAQVEIDAKL